VDDAGSVRSRQCFGDLNSDIETLGKRSLSCAEKGAKRVALDILADDEVRTVFFADLVDREDVGMIECGGCLGLLDKPLKVYVVPCVLLVDDLYCDLSAKLIVLSKINFSHSADTDQLLDPESTEHPSGRQATGGGAFILYDGPFHESRYIKTPQL
jgi:hypothetical protein